MGRREEEFVLYRRPCFFEVFSYLSSQRLKIPVKFVKHLQGSTCGSVWLTGPSGDVWLVELVRQNEDLYFDQGWVAFVRDHFVECGDLLVFRYDGELCFTVQVFDQSACEKESAFHSISIQDPSRDSGSTVHKRAREEEESVFLDHSVECAPKKVKGGNASATDMSDEGGYLRSAVSLEESLPLETRQCASHAKHSATKGVLKCRETELGIGPIFSEREKRVAQSFISCFPYFVRIMKKFNISGSYTLNVPYQFSTAHLPNCRTEVVLRTIKGTCWTVNSVPTTRVHTSHTFCGGWMAFVRNNNIGLGDVCIFELVRQCELRVFILRVGKDGSQNQGEIVTPVSNETENFLKKTGKSSLGSNSKHMKMSEVSRKKASKTSQAALSRSQPGTLKGKDETSNHSVKNIKAELDSEAGVGLRVMVARDEEKALKSFASGFPNFARIMRKFNTSGSYTLKIPHQFSRSYLPNNRTEILLRNVQGKCWTVNSIPDSKGRTGHTLCGGWMAFVRDNDVKMGDTCIFELTNDCEMRVHISGVGGHRLDHLLVKSASSDLHNAAIPSNSSSL